MILTLKEALVNINCDSNWLIYATDLHPDAEADYGQRIFSENGGLPKHMKFIMNGETAQDALQVYCDGEDLDWFTEHSSPAEFYQWLVEEDYFWAWQQDFS